MLPRATAIHHVRQPQALPDAQLFGQVEHRLGGRLATEKLVGNAAEREHIQARAESGIGTVRLRRQIDHPRVLDVILDMLSAGCAVNRIRRCGIAGIAGRGLPVHQAQVERTAADAIDEDALGPQSPVVEALRVGVLERFSDVADELQSLGDREIFPDVPVAQPMIQTNRLGIVVEDERGAEFGLFVVLDLQDARVVDAFEDFELAARLANPRGTNLRARCLGYRVDANAPMHRVDADVLGLPILKPLPLGEKLPKAVVAYLLVLVGRADAGLGKCTRDSAGLLRINRFGRAVRDAIRQRADDTRVVYGAGAAVLKCRRPGQAFKSAGQAARREKDCRLDEGQAHLRLDDGGLPAQQAGQALGFAVGEDDRVIDRGRSSIRRPGPAMHVAGQHARTALDLDQEEAGRREHQGVHLADLALVVDELEVRPDVPGVAVGQVAS